MKKTLGSAALILLAAAGPALASGYRIPEQSVNSTARAGSYVAYTPSADAAYYNPANMAWLEKRAQVEIDATWIHLSAIDYRDARGAAFSGDSEEENFLLPTLFAVSPEYHNFRIGFSMTAPAGLSKQWRDFYPRSFAEEFTLKVFEFNPSLCYRISDRFSIGAGVRAVYTEGKVKSNRTDIGLTRDLDGDSLDWGYNLAFSARPVDNLQLAVTYRSRVDLSVEGDARLGFAGLTRYSGPAEVEIPLPAVLAVAASYTFFDQLTVELGYDRTYWSSYEYLDFNYATRFTAMPLSTFDSPLAKHWSDTDAWRLSATYDLKNNWILMAGFAIDQNPVPDSTLGFELPDSDALLYSLGVRYRVNDNMELGLAYLLDVKDKRTVNNGTVNGVFEDATAHLLTFGFTYKL